MMQNKIKKLLENPPEYKFPAESRRKLIARLYEIQPAPSRPVFIPSFAAAMATVIIIFGYTHFFLPLYPTVVDSAGAKVRLRQGGVVKTSGDEVADIKVRGLYHLRLKGDSEIKLIRTRSRAGAGSIQFNLAKGNVFTRYKKTGKKKFEIKTPEAVFSAVGTGFKVETAPGANKSWLGVLDGAVRVTAAEMAPVLVEAGQKMTVREGMAPADPARMSEEELLGMQELYRIGENPQVALIISTGKTRVRELLSFIPLYISVEKDVLLPMKIREAAASFERAMKSGSKQSHLDTIEKFEEIIRAHPSPKYDVQILLFTGAYYEYLNVYDKAIATFQKIIDEHPKSALRSLAQCAIAIIYEESLSSPDKARAAYEKILSEYPQSPEVFEANLALTRLR